MYWGGNQAMRAKLVLIFAYAKCVLLLPNFPVVLEDYTNIHRAPHRPNFALLKS